ncbi:MAG: hypothetical protein ACRDTH_25655 [Pseudonocardiaceae bacterium]
MPGKAGVAEQVGRVAVTVAQHPCARQPLCDSSALASLPEDLQAAIRGVADGPALLALLAPGRLDVVTDRERALTPVARGLSNTEIAAQLHLSLAAARTRGPAARQLDSHDRDGS